MEENIKTPTRSSFVDLVHYSALARFRDDFAFIRRRQICDLIIIFRLLNATFRFNRLHAQKNEVSETYTGDGSVDAKGKPVVKQNTEYWREYWRACWFIIGRVGGLGRLDKLTTSLSRLERAREISGLKWDETPITDAGEEP
ncbi:hypothetical protein F8388_020813 [Cannabis sativa]|uniref:Uncharacterized protein n=1 Tax=Cannabis sativa TaxID=3483 RepID=A0A7J6FK48_CANSA|nr:hypothetical protein F8388_020813 [Cannabis sativa]